MNKKLPALLGLIIVIIIGFTIFRTKKEAPPIVLPVETASTTAPTDIATPSPQSPTEVKRAAWVTFLNYLAFAKDKNVEGLKTVSYKLSETCQDKSKIDECNLRMKDVYDIGSKFKEEDFTHLWFDDKQIVLFTDWRTEETDLALGYARHIIYFIRDKDGKAKVLFFTLPDQITYTAKTEGRTREEMLKRVDEMTKDTDKDTADDELEKCLGVPDKCSVTDPTNRDTDGDGYWDGVELYMK